MDPIIIIINDASFGVDQPWNALRLALIITFTAINQRLMYSSLEMSFLLQKKDRDHQKVIIT